MTYGQYPPGQGQGPSQGGWQNPQGQQQSQQYPPMPGGMPPQMSSQNLPPMIGAGPKVHTGLTIWKFIKWVVAPITFLILLVIGAKIVYEAVVFVLVFISDFFKGLENLFSNLFSSFGGTSFRSISGVHPLAGLCALLIFILGLVKLLRRK